jgi:hypothetical protein
MQAFQQEGLAALPPKSHAPHHVATKLPHAHAQAIAHLLHRSPRDFGKATSVWPLDLLIAVRWSEHLIAQRVSDETLR